MLTMERHAVAELIPFINPTAVSDVLRGVWTGATDTLMVNLANQLTASYLALFGLTLLYGVGSANTRVFTIQSNSVHWFATEYPQRVLTLPSVPPSNSARIVREMQFLMRVEATVVSTKKSVASRAVASVGPPPSAAQPAVVPTSEMLSVTIPATYPQCGSEMMITSPSTGEKVQYSVPPGSVHRA